MIPGVLLAAGLVVSVPLAVMLGPVALPVRDVWAVIFDHLGLAGPSGLSRARDSIVWELRLPRVLLAGLVGGGLAAIGTVMQAVIRNPLADPYLLGISSGASVGAVCVVILGIGGGVAFLATGAFIGALASFVLVLLLASGLTGRLATTRTVLAGVAVAYLCSALTSLITIVAGDAHATRGILFWLLGTLAGARWSDIPLAAGAVATTVIVAFAYSRTLDIFAFGDEAASTLGVNVQATKWILLTVTALSTGVLVALSGAVGFVGLVLPHGVRFLIGDSHRRLLPLSTLAGALFLIWVDTLGRVAFAPNEVPVGVLTALLGVPAFAVLLWRRSVD